MTFSAFAKMMYPLIGNGETTSDFVIFLTNLMMEKPPAENEKDKQQDIDDYNPLSHYRENTCAKYYNGQRPLSQNIARKIISRLDKSQFSDFLMELPNDVIVAIGATMEKNGVKIINNDIVTTCTDLFESTLYACANKDKRRDKRTYSEKIAGMPKGCNMPLMGYLQLRREYERWQDYKNGVDRFNSGEFKKLAQSLKNL